MGETNDLSPWIHPKAQAWFGALFNRTNLDLSIEDELNKPVDQLTPEAVRAILAIAVLMSRQEIWPKGQRGVLKRAMRKAQEYCQLPPTSQNGNPLTLVEHQAHKNTVVQMTQELELLRRKLGISVRKTKVETPESWGPFWE